ncbi:NAD-dependent epimerase/dehydratase family protein [Kaistia geumhonensis]|uniref:Nucleoside-diphosphate-sugar epimerase n=1 Tax=Kaistia geumhonensis TaxID=410839 RepID=A0ABU0MBR2_9HYPH|nr:NAD-dependent epimerase/dehydratase family protein [Kaistia geumhonensis]MCX5481345.1 NAD-dependent epimerase/dehydratase family protein [Kaistia geumhonensis]MDQ0518406.1 nucleoside-diphosphate-sugar epimerase [Kaistia geumhonensis]
MSRVVIIGGSGHVGTYLVPRLVEAGFHVVNVSRGQRQPYTPHKAWDAVEQVAIDRDRAEEADAFGGAIFDLKPDILIDMTCFTLASARQIVEAVKGEVEHFLHTGTIWVHGPSVTVPTTEMEPRRPFGDYGIQKAAIEAYLLHEARRNGFPATIVHPGHIVGPGWAPLNPEGHFDTAVFSRLARGQQLRIPNFGLETVHHVHADDVAQMFMRAIARRSVAIGEAFHTVSPAAVTLRGYAERMAAWFGREADLAFLPFAEWKMHYDEATAQATYDHIAHSPNCSIDKARAMLGYAPRYSSLEAVQESVAWLIENGEVKVA